MTGAPRAVLFDLYGTLLAIERRFERELPRRLGADRRRWAQLLRRVLLVTPLSDEEELVDRMLLELGGADRDPSLREEALAIVRRELAGVRLLPGALATLRFLRRRGLPLGLVSNLAGPFRAPFVEHGLAPLFDAVAFSCVEGRIKPDPELYRGVCRQLGVAPGEALMIGDSLANDVVAPRRLGLRSLQVALERRPGVLQLVDVGWLSLDQRLEPLLHPGQELDLGGRRGKLETFESVADDEQGRYNLVSSGVVRLSGGERRRVYFKRFLLPESAWVEELARRLLEEVEVPPCPGGVLAGSEPVLWAFEAAGEKLRHPRWSPELAYEIGRHGATAYLFANADLRPRNAFLDHPGGQPRLVMVDHEHSFFNLALDLEGLGELRDPRQLDALGAAARQRVTRRVVTPATMRRTRRAFFGAAMGDRGLAESYRQGWLEVHYRAQRRRERIAGLLHDRLYREPFLVVGTHGHRRPLAALDIEDLLERVARDPRESVEESI